MTKISRRQLVSSIAAMAASAVVPRLPEFVPADPPAATEGLSLLLANADRVSDIGPGWISIVSSTLEKMRALDPDFEVRQVKQKFGGLRIYYRSHNYEQLQAAVIDAERLCANTCEECGKAGTISDQNGRIRTLCKDHRGNGRRRTRTKRSLSFPTAKDPASVARQSRSAGSGRQPGPRV